MQLVGLAFMALAWQLPALHPISPTLRTALTSTSHSGRNCHYLTTPSPRLRFTPLRAMVDEDGSEDDGADAARQQFNDYVRSGGFIDGRPPDDLDKLATFEIDELPLAGKLLIGTAVFLTALLAIFLLVA